MEVKGTAVKSVKEFVKANFSEKYSDWEGNLSSDSKDIFNKMIVASSWYDINSGLIEPTKQVGKIIFNNDLRKGAWEMGRYSAETALTGIYKVFLLLATPTYIIGRAGKVFETYFKPIKMDVVEKNDKGVMLHMTDCKNIDQVLEWRIGGWMEKALEMCGCKNLKINIEKSAAKGSDYTCYKITWE